MDDELQEPLKVTRVLAWLTAVLLAVGVISAVAVSDESGAADRDLVTATGGVDAPTTTVELDVPTTTTTTLAVAPTTTVAAPAPTAAPPTTRAARATTTTTTTRPPVTTTRPPVTATTTTTAAGVMLTVINNAPLAVTLRVNDRSFNLTAGQQAGPVPIARSANGYDTVELRLVDAPTCGLGDADSYFPTPGHYRLTITPTPNNCHVDPAPIAGVTYRVTPA